MIDTDAVIIGAGPIGLFQAFQLGLQEARCHLIDVLPYPGGQCVELYADKPIYDIPGIPVCTGRELIERLLTQVAPFQPQLHLGQLVSAIEKQDDGLILTRTSSGLTLRSKVLIIAAGVGAFQPRCPSVEGLHDLTGTHLFFQPVPVRNTAGKHVLILGDGDSALDAALALSEQTALPLSITLMHRRDVFVANVATQARFRAQVATGAIRFIAGQLNGIQTQNGTLQATQILTSQGELQTLATDSLLVLQGLSPKLGAIADWGMAMERRQLQVSTETFATSLPGVFAVGDINTYAGKKKLILCGFHEATLAAFAAMEFITPHRKVLLQYTTTSTRLHQLLNVKTFS
jgi:thioredoxin reductase (NADPH)